MKKLTAEIRVSFKLRISSVVALVWEQLSATVLQDADTSSDVAPNSWEIELRSLHASVTLFLILSSKYVLSAILLISFTLSSTAFDNKLNLFYAENEEQFEKNFKKEKKF